MDYNTWTKAVKVVEPYIQKTKVENVDYVLPIITFIYNTQPIYLKNCCIWYLINLNDGRYSKIMDSSLM